MGISGITSLYSYYDPYGLSALGNLSPLSSLTGVRQSTSLGGLGGLGQATSVSVSSLGRTLNSLGDLEQAASRLVLPGAFSSLSVSSSAGGIASGTAAEGTARGSYSVTVSQLAQGQVLTSGSQATPYTSIGSGADTQVTFQFADGRSASLDLNGSDNTLNGLAAAVNRAGIGISASVESDANGYRLRLSGESGASNAFTVSASGDETLAGFFTNPPGGNGLLLTQQAQNAQGTVNGTAFTSGTNQTSTAVPGLNLKLAGTGNVTLTVSQSASQTQVLEDFVAAYNEVLTGLSQLSQGYGGLGLGGQILRSSLTESLTPGTGTGGSSSINRLADVGISANGNGTLRLNQEVFNAAIARDAEGVARLFASGDGKGIAERLLTRLDEGGALSAENVLQAAAPSLTFSLNSNNFQSALISSLFSQPESFFNQFGSLTSNSLLSSSNSNEFLFNNLLQGATQSYGLSGLGLVGGLTDPALITTLFNR